MFETALPSQSRNRRRWAALPAAVGIHLTALVVVVGADYWSIKPVAVPETNAVFVSFTPPPLPAAAPAGPAARPQAEPVRPEPVRPQQPVQPQVIEDLAEPRPSTVTLIDPAVISTVKNGGAGGSDNGSDRGIDGGVEGGDPNSTSLLPGSGPVTPLAEPAGPIRINAKVKKPEIIPGTRVDPRYPEPARRVKVQGAVILEAVIDERGNVTSVRVLKGLPMGLDQAAIDAVARWRFQPATLDGRPVAVYYNLTVNFEVR